MYIIDDATLFLTKQLRMFFRNDQKQIYQTYKYYLTTGTVLDRDAC